jgi:predicted Zn-dependent protease
VVTFLSYGGKTFQLLGFTLATKMPAYAAAFQHSLTSFNALTDPAALNVQPARLEIVRVPNDMSVQQFNSQFPSTVPLEQIALINAVETQGTLKGGQLAKRVVGGVPPPK